MDKKPKRIQGRITFQELVELVNRGSIETVHIVIVDYCGRLAGSHRFFADKFLEMGENPAITLSEDRIAFGLDGIVVLNDFVNLETGIRNRPVLIDYNSLALSWFSEEAIVFYEFCDPVTKLPNLCCPRALLKKFVDDYSAENIAVKAASEMEFYMLERVTENTFEITMKDCKQLWPTRGYCDTRLSNRLEPVIKEIRQTCRKAGVDIEASQIEDGPGQLEFQIQYEDVLGMCDSQIKFREIVRTVAYNHKMHATFMSKIWKDFPGSGCHFHISLWDKVKGENIFSGNDFVIDEKTGVKASNNLLYFIGGLSKHLKDLFPMLAQYVNSYKRFKPLTLAPLSFDLWGYDNRFLAFRVVGAGPSLRVEVRIAGGDVNPYWGYSAVLACGLKGIKEKILPPPISKGNVTGKEMTFPKSLSTAVEYFKNSKVSEEILGSEVKNFLMSFYKSELEAYESEISEWEQNRYFDKF